MMKNIDSNFLDMEISKKFGIQNPYDKTVETQYQQPVQSFLNSVATKDYFENTFGTKTVTNGFVEQFSQQQINNTFKLKAALDRLDEFLKTGLINSHTRDEYYAVLDWNLAQSTIAKDSFEGRSTTLSIISKLRKQDSKKEL